MRRAILIPVVSRQPPAASRQSSALRGSSFIPHPSSFGIRSRYPRVMRDIIEAIPSARHMSSDRYYADLPVITEFAAVTRAESYAALPDDWHLALCDVRDSTAAVEAG